MRIQHKIFPLTIGLRHANENQVEINVFGLDSEPLLFERKIEGNLETIDIQTYLPNTVKIELTSDAQAELTSMSLAGIKVNNELLKHQFDYDPLTGCSCIVIDLFHPNPFAYHMYKGNKIRF
jgi:hypothetical protein